MLKSMNFLSGKSRGEGFGLLRVACNDAVTNGEGMHRPWCNKILGTGPSMTGGRGSGFVRLLRSARNDVFNDTPHSALSRHSCKPPKKGLLYFSICLTHGRYNKRGAANTTSIGKPSACIRCQCVGRPFGQTIKLVLLAHFAWCSTLYTGAKQTAHYFFYCLLRGIKAHSLVALGAREYGRSMIEMLGVLAIIGVLSVGGIAGYSQAMEKFKLNKTISEYSYLIYGLLEHIDDLKSVPVGMGQFNFTDFAKAINIVPSSWTAEDNKAMWDNNGNIVQSYSGGTVLLLDFYLGGWQETADSTISANFSPKLCVEMFNNIMIPLHSAVYSVNTYNSTKGDITFFGDAYCSNGRDCLGNASLAQIKSACEHCDASGVCCITIRFPL